MHVIVHWAQGTGWGYTKVCSLISTSKFPSTLNRKSLKMWGCGAHGLGQRLVWDVGERGAFPTGRQLWRICVNSHTGWAFIEFLWIF